MPGVPSFKDPILCSQEKSLQSPGGREAVSYQYETGKESLLSNYFSDRPHLSGLYLSHAHPSPAPFLSLPAPKVSRAASFCTFWRFCFLYIYIYNCTTLAFWSPVFYCYCFFPIFFISVGLCLFENPFTVLSVRFQGVKLDTRPQPTLLT